MPALLTPLAIFFITTAFYVVVVFWAQRARGSRRDLSWGTSLLAGASSFIWFGSLVNMLLQDGPLISDHVTLSTLRLLALVTWTVGVAAAAWQWRRYSRAHIGKRLQMALALELTVMPISAAVVLVLGGRL